MQNTRSAFKRSLDFITAQSVMRSERWHNNNGQHWTIMEWLCAMCGEAGEAANVAKKLQRQRTGMLNGISTGLTEQELKDKLGQEFADTFFYMILAAHAENINLEYYIIKTFNDKSQEYGFPERL